jgi:putative tryptophan/tyrosine transport system substrate-binding protein
MLAAPFRAAGQPARTVPRVGVLWPNPPATFDFVKQGLSEHGYVEGRNIAFEYRWAENQLDRLGALATELVQLRVDLIITLAPPAALAARDATRSIPIVCVAIGDPVASGLVPSLARPGGNITGTTRMLSEMSEKHVEFIKQAVPAISRLAVLWNPTNTSHPPALKAAQAAAQALGVWIVPLEVRGAGDIDGAFAAMVSERVDALLFLADPVFFVNLSRMAELVRAARLPSVSNFTEFARMGGLIGYSPSIPDEFRRVADHIDKILKGAKAGDLPIQRPNKFELVINLNTAKALGLTIPQSLLLRADHVIE